MALGNIEDLRRACEDGYPSHSSDELDEVLEKIIEFCSSMEIRLKLLALRDGLVKGTT